jgi:hypothetical protein
MLTTDPAVQPRHILAKSIDGSRPLIEQQLSLRYLEARGYEFVSFTPDAHGTPWNIVFMRQLPAGQIVADLHLILETAAPEGTRALWQGAIHVEGVLQRVLVYRE